MIEKELKERIWASILISPIIILVAIPTTNLPIYIGFIYLFFVLLATLIFLETVKLFERKNFYIPKLKKVIFITFIILSILVLSSLSLVGKLPIKPDQKQLSFLDIGSIFSIFSVLTITTLLLNLSISSLNIYKHNYFEVDTIFFTISFYLSICISSMLILKLIDVDTKTFFLAFVLGVGWFSEAGGLIIGKLIGRIKLSFLSSPNKTLEGTIGMLIFGVIGGILFKLILTVFGYQNALFLSTYTETTILSALVVTLCFFGDIIESLIKRFFDSKDSSTILLSLGGLFDVFDGVMFASFGVMLYYFLV